MSSNSLNEWVSDHIIDIIGGYDDAVIDYCISAAKSSKNVNQLIKKMTDFGLTMDSKTERFVNDLFSKANPTKVDVVKKPLSKKYAFVSDEIKEEKKEVKKKDEDVNVGGKRAADEALENSTEAGNSGDEIDQLRKLARQKYLSKREEDKLSLLRLDVEDWEAEIEKVGWESFSKREKREYQRSKQIIDLVDERKKIQQGPDRYEIPEDYLTEKGKIDKRKKQEALTKRYQADHSKNGETWEEEQTSRALKDKEEEKSKKIEYEYVFDESQAPEFIQEDNDGLTAEENALEERIKREEAKIQQIEDTRKSLPVYEYREQLLGAIKEHNIMIVIGETGSGKTTQLPQYLHEAGYTLKGKVACTQPRRVAAMSVSARVAEEVGTELGQKVGYSVRFDDKTGDKTLVKYMTDGMLLREFMTDPELGSYSCIMIDEAHERTLSTDILFGLLKDISRARPDFKLLIASATMDAKKFSRFFDNAPIFKIPGRRFKVDIHYTKQPEANYLHAAITTVFQIHTTQKMPGDILVFLTGQDEIEAAEENIKDTMRKLQGGGNVPELIVCPIYSNLPPDLQQRIFEPTPPGSRKVVLATNIAETSITIDGIVYVIDPGFVKEDQFNPTTGMESLVVTPCSQASADQRAGRAGRVGPGKCFRLYTKWAFNNELPQSTTPEILRTKLGGIILTLMSLGIPDIFKFDFLDAPPKIALAKAMEQLYCLGALNSQVKLTKLGRQMAEFPADPMIAKSIISSHQFQCSDEVITIMAMLGESAALFYRPKKEKEKADRARNLFTRIDGGDHLTLLEIYNQWVEAEYSGSWASEHYIQQRSLKRAREVREQLIRLCDRVEVEVKSLEDNDDVSKNIEPIMKSIAAGFFTNAARLGKHGDAYKSVAVNQSVHIHPSSVLTIRRPHWVIYNELVLTSKEFMRNVMPIKREWIYELAPQFSKNIKE